MKIDELPAELLIKIFSFLLTYKKVSLVSRRFYEVACRVNERNACLTFNQHLLTVENLKRLVSIEGSNRKILNVEIDLGQGTTAVDLRRLISILSKFSETIKHLRLKGYPFGWIGITYFFEILSLVPNAESLFFFNLRAPQSDKHQLETSNNEDLNLKHLKILTLLGCEEVFQVVFNRLSAGVLTEFTLAKGNLRSLNTLFSRQTSIKNLSLCSTRDAPAHILDNLELNSLQILDADIQIATLSRQTKLKSLSLNVGNQVDEHIMEVVANRLTELEEFYWSDIAMSVKHFVNIRRLKNLKHLALAFLSFQPEILDEFIQLDNSRIAILEIASFDGLPTHQIQKLAKSAPKLKVLTVSSHLMPKQISAFFKHFNFVECLRFCYDDNFGSYENYLNQNDSVNAKLSELTFSIEKCKTSIIRKMISDFPNLTDLSIWSKTVLTSSHFRLILDGFAKLKAFQFNKAYELTIDDFKYLRGHRKHLQVLRLNEMSYHFINRLLTDLEALFEVVKYSYDWLLLKM